MAKCPECGSRYGLLGLDRRAAFQSCPKCGWNPSGNSESSGIYEDPENSFPEDRDDDRPARLGGTGHKFR